MQQKIILLLILILGLFLRLYGINWDSGFHLHPDERFLTMVNNAMVWPKTIGEYFDPHLSKLNPSNIGYNFFVYGTFPLILTKFFAINFGFDDYSRFTLLGRFFSGFFDFLIIILIYQTTVLLINKIMKKNESPIPFLSAFFYAVSVYPIQSSHFFTTDTFLNFFMFASFYFALKFYFSKGMKSIILSSIFFGLALSCKISALYILPLNLTVIFLNFFQEKKNLLIKIKKYFLLSTFYFLLFYLTLRLANPYYFQSSNFLDPRLNQRFISSIKELNSFNHREAWYPPGVQWINKPVYSLFLTTFLVGLGPINFILMTIGLIYISLKLKTQNSKPQLKTKNFVFLAILFWLMGYFIYQSLHFVKSIRYTIYLYPFYAIFGGFGILVILNRIQDLNLIKKFIDRHSFQDNLVKKIFQYFLLSTFYFLLFLWPLLFFTVYLNKNTRVQASEWIYQNLPNNSVILGEHWDDPLPLPVVNNYGKNFQVELLPIFGADDLGKWNEMKRLLEKADYYVLSSNRGWGSIPTVPERYPLMSQFYDKLFKEECFDIKIICQNQNCRPELVAGSQFCFKKIKEFLPYYYKFIRYPDSWIEETFTVYDHQTVLIYERVKK